MRIILLADQVSGNTGWSRYARDLAYGLKKAGHDVLCLVETVSPDTNISQEPILTEPLSYVFNLGQAFLTARRVNKVIKEYKPDIVQFVVEPYSTMIPFIKKDSFRIVLNAHSTFAYLPVVVSAIKRPFLGLWVKLVYAKTDVIICISRYTRQYLLNYAPKLVSKIEVVLGAINIDELPVPQASQAKSDKSILFVGAIKPRKGLIESLEALANYGGDFLYHIVGAYSDQNDYVALLKRKIKDLQLQDRVIMTGRLSDKELFNLYNQADLFLMLSTNNGVDFEGFGLVYIEANYYGVPCIGPSDSGVSDAIIDGETGYLVDPHNPVEVAVKIKEVLVDKKIKPEACVAWAKACAVINQVKHYERIYTRIILK